MLHKKNGTNKYGAFHIEKYSWSKSLLKLSGFLV